MKTASIKRKAKWRPFNFICQEVNHNKGAFDISF